MGKEKEDGRVKEKSERSNDVCVYVCVIGCMISKSNEISLNNF